MDAAGVIAFVNQAAQEMLRAEEGSLVGRAYREAFLDTSDPLSSEADSIGFSLAEKETVFVRHDVFRRANGTFFPVEYACAPQVEEGKLTGAVITFQDIGEKLDLQAAFFESRARAMALAEEKARFLAVMSHEIRTPLGGMIGLADLLKDDSLSAEQAGRVSMLRKSSEHLLDIVNDILDLSKSESGKLRLDNERISLRDFVAELAAFYQPTVNQKGLTLKISVAENCPTEISLDAGRLRQVAGNLLSNAIKFTEKGGMELSVSTVPKDAERLLFAVRDSGIGIKPEMRRSIFDPYVQAESGTTRRYGGTGLGLAIARQFIAAMGGEIWVESETEEDGGNRRGSCFWFTVFIANDVKDVVETDSLPGVVSAAAQPASRVMVVEDNEVNRHISLTLLRQLGVAAEIARNGREAVELARQKCFDVILMDCHMPEMDGYTATREIRKLANGGGRCRIVALTASAMGEEVEKCFAAGMDDYLTKPISKETLARILGLAQPEDKESDGLQPRENGIDAVVFGKLIEIENRGAQGFVKKTVDIYFDHSAKLLGEIDISIQNKDFELLGAAAHSLKGSSAGLGFTAMRNHSETLEAANEKKDFRAISEVFAKMKLEQETLKESVKKLLTERAV